jgi:hypothetical protein
VRALLPVDSGRLRRSGFSNHEVNALTRAREVVMLTNYWVLFVMLFTNFAAASLGAGEIAPLDLTTLPKQASLVVTGYVMSTRITQSGSGVLEKISIVRVVSVLQGAYVESSLRVRTRTGLVFFDRHLDPGDTGVFFLKRISHGPFEAAYPGSFALFQRGTVKRPSE